MENNCIPKDLYGELASKKRPNGRPQLRFKNVCKRDLKTLAIDTKTWEAAAADRATWRHTVQKGLRQLESELKQPAEEKRVTSSSGQTSHGFQMRSLQLYKLPFTHWSN